LRAIPEVSIYQISEIG